MTAPASARPPTDRLRARRAPGRRDAGFTILELLVGLLLLAMLLALLPGAFRLTQRIAASEAGLAEDAQRAGAGLLLERTLTAALPLVERRPDGRLGLAFHGGGDRLSFVASLPQGPAGAGLYRLTLELEPAGAGHAAMLTLAPFAAGSSAAAAAGSGPRRQLLIGTEPGQLRYFGAQQNPAVRQWWSEWSNPDAFPELVEVTLPGDGGRASVPLLVRLRLTPPG